MKKIETEKAPSAIGPYSQGVEVGDFVFTSGQIPKNQTGTLREQTHDVIDSLEAILEAAGCGLADAVRVDVFLTNLKDDFHAMNEEYAKRFNGPVAPARQTIEVSALPKQSIIEISCIAKRNK